jgi:hypothetical protein
MQSAIFRIRRDGSIDGSKPKETRQHKKDSPESIRAEIDGWAAEDPIYKRIVEGIREELRCRDSRETERCNIHYSTAWKVT